MKKNIIIFFVLTLLMACKDSEKSNSYRVSTKDSANFSVMTPEIQTKEKIVIKINNEVIWIEEGKDSIGNPGAWRYYKYPGKIKTIQFLDYYKGSEKINKLFKDTLTEIPQRTLIITRPFPKGMTNSNWRKYGFVSIDTGERSIVLVNDAVYFKGMWTDMAQ